MWRELRRLLPNESLTYLGDGKNCPYGGRSREAIVGFAESAVETLLSQGVKLIVVGCNTATTAAIDHLRERWPEIPIVGLEPAVKPACLTTRSRKIAVLATEHSLQSDMFLRTASRYAEDVEVIKVVGRDFVEIVEDSQEHSERAEIAVRSVVEPLLGAGVDKIVLGCTHYPFLRPLIERVVEGYDIEVIDSGEAVARRVKWLLERYDIATDDESVAELKFCTFADESYRQRLEDKALSIDSELRNECK